MRWARRSTRWQRRSAWVIPEGPSSRVWPKPVTPRQSTSRARSTAKGITASRFRASRRRWSTISSRKRPQGAPSICPILRHRSSGGVRRAVQEGLERLARNGRTRVLHRRRRGGKPAPSPDDGQEAWPPSVRVTLPPRDACTDNAAMIAEVARRKFECGEFSGFDIDADPNMTL